MNNMSVIIWLFPILFIFHDFEEIILMQAWIKRNNKYLSQRFPKLSKKFLSHLNNITTSSFAFGVAEEFLLINVITITAFMTKWYSLWIGVFIAFVLHLLIHCIQALILRKYVPAIITSVICLPICSYIIEYVIQLFLLNTIIIYSIIGFAIMVFNLVIVHKGMRIFNKWLIKYEHEEK